MGTRAYIGAKIILAEPQERDGAAGYRVIYANPGGTQYESWSPKAVFEEAYRPVSPGEADLIESPDLIGAATGS